MAFKSRVLYWNCNETAAEETQKSLSDQGIDLHTLSPSPDFAGLTSDLAASTLVMDFRSSPNLSESDFASFQRAVEDQNLRLLMVAPQRDRLPDFVQNAAGSAQILTGPALDQQLKSRLRLITRIETMEEEITRRAQTSHHFGIEAPYRHDEPPQSALYFAVCDRGLEVVDARRNRRKPTKLE